MKRLQGESTSLARENTSTPRTHRTRKILVGILLILLVLALGSGVFYVAFLNHTFTTNIKHEALLPTATVDETPSVVNPSGESASTGEPPSKGALNILLIGSDGRTSVANGRSDVIILMHINADRKKAYLVHFPRDMYVSVPGHGKDKINAAYAYGGSQLLVLTLRSLVDVPVDHVAVVGFEGFAAMTDAVGGVDVYAEEASVDEVYNETRTEKWYNTVHVGVNHLSGQAALAFVRERYQLSQGDISRGRRQQAFVKALMLKTLSKETLANPVRFARFVDAATSYLTVDSALSDSEVYSLALSMKNLRSDDIVFITAPITGFGRSPQGASIDLVDYTKMAELSAALKIDRVDSLSFGH